MSLDKLNAALKDEVATLEKEVAQKRRNGSPWATSPRRASVVPAFACVEARSSFCA